MTDPITRAMQDHYGKTFDDHGCTSEGVDWGVHEDRALLRHERMGDLIEQRPCSILDVGCGYGAFLDYLGNEGIDFTGIDVVSNMIDAAKGRHPNAAFICGNFLEHDFGNQTFDYVVCNGIFTQKFDVSDEEMNTFTQSIVKKMFSLADIGIVFNMMTSFVNFRADNLFYKNPTETIDWVMNNLTWRVKLNQAYPLYEYMVYAYQPGAIKSLQK